MEKGGALSLADRGFRVDRDRLYRRGGNRIVAAATRWRRSAARPISIRRLSLGLSRLSERLRRDRHPRAQETAVLLSRCLVGPQSAGTVRPAPCSSRFSRGTRQLGLARRAAKLDLAGRGRADSPGLYA